MSAAICRLAPQGRKHATEIHGTTPISSELEPQISLLADAIERLADTPGPWPDELRADMETIAARTVAHPAAPPAQRDALTAILRAAADDLASVVAGGGPQATASDNGRAWHP